MALTNCTINQTSFQATPNQAFGNITSQIVDITPNSGFVVRASDFTVGALPSGISAITLSDSVAPYDLLNKVKVVLNVDDNYSPSGHQTIIFDVDGAAVRYKEIQWSVAGNITFNSNEGATISPSATAFAGTGQAGSNAIVLSRTVTAPSGKFLDDANATAGASPNWSITSTETLDSTNTFVVAKQFVFKFLYPEADTTGQALVINAIKCSNLPTVSSTKFIRSVNVDTTDLPWFQQSRTLKIYGDVGAQFNIRMSDGNGNYYNFTDNEFNAYAPSNGLYPYTIDSTGLKQCDIRFPFTTATTTYTFRIDTSMFTGTDLVEALDGTGGNDDGRYEFSISRISTSNGKVKYTVDTDSASSRSYTLQESKIYTGTPNQVVADNLVEKSFTLKVTDNVNIQLNRQPTTEDFTATNCDGETGDSSMSITEITSNAATNSNVSQVIFSIKAFLDSFGTADSKHTLNLDSFINAEGGIGGNLGGGSFSKTLIWSYEDTETTAPASIIANSSYKGTLNDDYAGSLGQTSNPTIAQGATTIIFRIEDWDLNAQYAGLPSYFNARNDVTVEFRIRNNMGVAIVDWTLLDMDLSQSTFSSSAASIWTQWKTISVSSLAAVTHTIQMRVLYADNPNQ